MICHQNCLGLHMCLRVLVHHMNLMVLLALEEGMRNPLVVQQEPEPAVQLRRGKPENLNKIFINPLFFSITS